MADTVKSGDVLVIKGDGLEKLFAGEVLEVPGGATRLMIQQLYLDILKPLSYKKPRVRKMTSENVVKSVRPKAENADTEARKGGHYLPTMS